MESGQEEQIQTEEITDDIHIDGEKDFDENKDGEFEEQNENNNDGEQKEGIISKTLNQINDILITGVDDTRVNENQLNEEEGNNVDNQNSEEQSTEGEDGSQLKELSEIPKQSSNNESDSPRSHDSNQNDEDFTPDSPKDDTQEALKSPKQNSNLPPLHSKGNEEPDEEDYEGQIDRTYHTHAPAPPNVLNPLLSYIKDEEAKAITEQNYIRGDKLRTVEKITAKALADYQNQLYADDRNQTYESLRNQYLKKMEDIDYQYNQLFEELEKQRIEDLDNLQKNHEKEEEDFTNYWADPEKLSQFNKPSPQLLQMRQIQKNLALSKDFSAAQQQKSIADSLQKHEEEESERQAILAMRTQYNQMQADYNRRVQCAEQKWERKNKSMNKKKESELEHYRLAIQQLDSKKNSPPRTRALSPMPMSRGAPTTSFANRKTLANYRTQPNQSKLKLSGISVNRCMHPCKSANQPFRPRGTRRYRGCSGYA